MHQKYKVALLKKPVVSCFCAQALATKLAVINTKKALFKHDNTSLKQ